MKTRLLTIVGIATASVFGTGFVLYSVTSYDFAPSTQENQYGVAARVLIQPTYVPSIVSSEDPPKLRDVLYFRYHSQSPIQLVGYNICNGIMCIKDEGQSYSLHDPTKRNQPHKWSGSTLGDLPWNAGDTVHIRVKVKPVIIAEDGAIIPLGDQVLFVDLGKSKIIKVSS